MKSMLRTVTWLLIGLSALGFGALSNSERPQDAKPKKPTKRTIDFNRDVRPILAHSCWTCHGPDPEPLKKTGNMRLDIFSGATKDRGGYRAITPFHPEKSMMLGRIAADEGMRMPPANSGLKPLTKKEQEILRQWIAEGAEYREHWAFVKPSKPTLPKVASPWLKNPIDLFILERLKEAGIEPEPEADKRTIVRRLSLTLTGLPPTVQETQAYVSDDKPGAYGRLLDRLMASPRYGENQARYWLDAVRYADTHGLHIDNERAVHPYRDWVVRALNEDLPFDQFTIWQLAGDLLPSPTLDQKIATGYIRMNPTTNEGGVIEEEFLAKNTMDRTDTTATIFLGVTMGCAKCHDHKYDPFSMKDYYSMYAFFNSTTDPVLDGNLKLHQPVMKAPSPNQAKALATLEREIEEVLAKTDGKEAKRWAAHADNKPLKAESWEVSEVRQGTSFDEAFATDPEPSAWRPLQGDPQKPFIRIVGKDNASVYVRCKIVSPTARKLHIQIRVDDGIKLWVDERMVHEKKAARSVTSPPDDLDIDLGAGENTLRFKVVNGGGEDGLGLTIGDAPYQERAKAFELASKQSLTPMEAAEIERIFLRQGPATAAATTFRELEAKRKALEDQIPFTYIAQELPKPRETRILKRGEYDQPGPLVSRSVPKALGALGGYPANRLGLAKWLVGGKNPLTARVIVNRVWQQHFGLGLVESSEDFGSRGTWPTHPELLDYLAVRFVEDGWSLKKLHRLILSSAAYRQASGASAAKRAKDPLNQLVSRGPRFRLDAEVVRDSALYVSGLLIERPGGPGDRPYHPEGLWEAIAYPISDTAKYVQDKGEALYRRSLYLFWKRTSPPPTMLLFDAPMRESCVVRRSTTNTPTQALATLNETGFFEAARAYAERTIKAGKSDEERVRNAFEWATGRTPKQSETKILLDLLSSERQRFKASPASAEEALKIGESPRDSSIDPVEHAAWMIVCNLILNLDEVLTQH